MKSFRALRGGNLYRLLKQSAQHWIAGSLVVAFALMSGCDDQPGLEELLNSTFALPEEPGPGEVTPPEPAAGCYSERLVQPASEITRKLDLLFVTDTSGSLQEERGAVADGIESFINALPVAVDLQVGVMLAHSPLSSHSGRLYQVGAEPVVLSTASQTLTQLQTDLRTKLTNVAIENATDGGEEGLLSLRRGLDDDRLAEMKGQGFFRDDAALAVVFIADENDICAVYPQGITPVPDAQNIEPVANARDCVRTAPAHVVDGIVITPSYEETIGPEAVVNKLVATKLDMPLVVGAIVYDDVSSVPIGAENEFGYGYVETVEYAGGITVDLADGSYEAGLNQIGQLANVKMNLQAHLTLSNEEVDPDTIEVFRNGQPAPFMFLPEMNQVQFTGEINPLDIMDVNYCQMEEPPVINAGAHPQCIAGSFVPKANRVVGFHTDPNEGSRAMILSGLSSVGITPIEYTRADIEAGQPEIDGVNALIIARAAVLSPVSQAFIDGVQNYVFNGGSLLAEYDVGALLFKTYNGINSAFTGMMNPNVDIFDGNAAGGGLVLPITSSETIITNSSHPIFNGISGNLNTGLRAAFAVTAFDSSWLDVSATFTSTGFGALVPAGNYPAILSGRCGEGRVAIYMMNYLSADTNTSQVYQIVNQTLNWIVGL